MAGITAAVIAVCVFLVLAILLHRWVGGAGRILLRAAVGVAVIALVNMALAATGVRSPLGVNAATAAVCALLGAPGLAALYIAAFLLV